MDFAEMLGDAYAYTKEGVFEQSNRWMKLILAIICLGLPFNGYILRIYRGAKPAPEVDGWGTLFIDGLKLLCVGLVYIIPLMLILMFVFVLMFLVTLGGHGDEGSLLASLMSSLFMIVFYIIEIIVAIFLPVAYIRFARTGTFAEAFNFSALTGTIGKIGWLNYIVGVLLVSIIIGIPLCILMFGAIFIFVAALILFSKNVIALIGLLVVMVLLLITVMPLVGVFQARYMTRLYDSAIPPAAPEQ